jgi:hypothetical protein
MIVYTRPGILMGSVTFFIALIALALPVVNGAFFYALCDRALPYNNASSSNTTAKTAEVYGTF